MLRVLNPGIYTTIQDLGRYNYRSYGVPVSGALDNYSAKFANLLLGNNENDAVLEVTMNGSFQFTKETVLCIFGADLDATLNDNPLMCHHPVKVEQDAIIKFNVPKLGVRAYLAVKGGFLNKPVLGSRSLFKEITKKYRLQKDDEIFYEPYLIEKTESHSAIKIDNTHFESQTIEAYQAPEFDRLNKEQQNFLETTVFTISKESNRMGYRLEEQLRNSLGAILTSAVLPGTVQLTPSGQLIVLMRDCGVTGGYPRVLQLTHDAIDKLAQKKPNDRFSFKIVALNK